MKTFLTLFFSLITLAGAAQQTWSLDDCMRYAAERSYTTGRAQRDLQQSKQDFTAAIGKHLPQVNGTIGANGNFGRGINPATNTYSNTTSFDNGYSAGVNLPIFNAFELFNNTLYSKVSKLRAESALQKAQDDAALLTMQYYIAVLYNRGLVDLTRKRVETYTRDLQRAERECELGVKSAADVAQIAASLAGEELQLTTRNNEYRKSVLSLKEVMNYPIEESLEVAHTLGLFAPDTLDAALIFDGAVNYLPAVEVLKRKLEGERLQLSIAKSSYYPRISASGGLSTNYFTMLSGGNTSPRFGSEFRNNLGEWVALNINIPIFNGLSARTKIHKAKISYKQAQSDFDEQMRRLRIEIEQAVMDCNTARSQVAGAEKSVNAYDLAYRAAQNKYEQGVLSVIELQTSANQLLSAQVDLLNSRLTYEIKCRQVSYYGGDPLIR